MKAAHSIICLVFIFLITLRNANSLQVGDVCQMNGSDITGVCRLMTNCLKVKNDFIYNAVLPTDCGYEIYERIVCCPLIEPTATTLAPDLDISTQKCMQYGQHVFTNVHVMTFASNSAPSLKRISRCGHMAIPLIVGGEAAKLKEFPHSALFGYSLSNNAITWECGGSLVSTRYVLTAAHCLKLPDRNKAKVSLVRLGELVIDDETDNATVIDIHVEKRIKFPGYRNSRRYNDIALLKLAHKVKLSSSIYPICLPTSDLDPEKAIATGWGTTSFQGDRSNALLKVTLESYNKTDCNNKFTNIMDRKLPDGIKDTQLCAGSRTEIRDTCQGDSGGPLQIYHPSIYCMYTQVGVTSFGKGCGTVDFPGIYTRVFNYVEWIKGIIWALGEDD